MAKRRSSRPNKPLSLLMLVGISVLAGALFAGLAVPFAALAGVSSSVVSDSVDALPAYLEVAPEAMRTTIYLSNGAELAKLYDENREVLSSLDEISPIMRAAQVDIEDERFYEHGAMDARGTLRALLSNLGGGATQGGSSITQQYVKQVRIEAARAAGDDDAVAKAQETSITRKVEEMRYAIAIERRYTKDEILLRYLNIVYYGDGAYGVEAAAMHYFGVHASDLNLYQASMIAGIVQNPNLDPVSHPEEAQAKQGLVLDAMLKTGSIEGFIEDGTIVIPGCEDTESAEGKAACKAAKAGKTTQQLAEDLVAELKATPFDPSNMKVAKGGCVGATYEGVDYSIVCHYIEEVLYNDTFFGDTAKARESEVKRGGYNIYTTIRPEFQAAAQAAVTAFAAPTDPVIVTINEVQPGTGEIWAMAQNQYELGTDKSQGQTFYVNSVSETYGGKEGFQAGSTFKTFTAAAALDQGFPPSYKINSTSPITLKNIKFADCDGNPNAVQLTGQEWKVSGGAGGAIDMYTAAQNSVNTYFAQLIIRVSPCAAAKMAKAAGVKLANGSDIVTGDPVKVDELRSAADADEAKGDALTAQAQEATAAGDAEAAAEYTAQATTAYANAADEDGEAEAYTGFWDKPSFTLGVAYVTPLSVAGAFATYGARGKACEPSVVTRIENRNGETVKDYNLGTDNCVVDAIRPDVMDGLNDVLKRVTFNGLGSNNIIDGRDQGSKTGTTEHNDNTWIVTYTPEIAVSVNVSVNTDPDPAIRSFWDSNQNGLLDETEKDMTRGVTLPVSGTYLYGWSWLDPPRVFNAAIQPVKDLIPSTAFVPPTAEILRGTPITPPNCTGSVTQIQTCYEDAGFSIAKSETYDSHPAGTYLSTSCEPYKGGLCTMVYSKGPRPEPTPDPKPSAAATQAQQPAVVTEPE
ncbi:MAG: penicillin-binding protein [Propionibacteriaceae bacterium]|jgi:membrane peptidoglycan carboxypeptidase|nr:penicillin-binding protein [Propionibacteriaceae bacterium]